MPDDFASDEPFEGPEKLLELWFAAGEGQHTAKSLRDVSEVRWQECLDSVNCKILSTIKNEHVTAFLLSESSMFVFDDKVYIKTCGTTTLLKCIPVRAHLLCVDVCHAPNNASAPSPFFPPSPSSRAQGMIKIAESCGLALPSLFYSRQDFKFPNKQLYPHSSFDAEIKYLHQKFPNGAAFTLGKVNGSHYNVFNAEAFYQRKEADASVEIMMSGLDQDIMQRHFQKNSFNEHTLEASGIGGLFEGALIDEFAFDPCGYSMNGILGKMVFTIHVTPEPTHCYASFECNAHMGDYTELLHKVLKIFNPSQFMVSLRTLLPCYSTEPDNLENLANTEKPANPAKPANTIDPRWLLVATLSSVWTGRTPPTPHSPRVWPATPCRPRR
jgi:S-adenosylmethionine decarboxylase